MFQHHRSPVTSEGQRLYFRQTPKYDPKRFNPTMPLNVLIQFRLYKWSFLGFNEVQRRYLMLALFYDTPIRPNRIGKILGAILPYSCGSEKERGDGRYWRFVSHLDLQYGLEYLLLTWLTDPRLIGAINLVPTPIETQRDYEATLRRIKEQSEEEDLAMLHLIHPRWDQERKGHGVHWNKDCLLKPE